MVRFTYTYSHEAWGESLRDRLDDVLVFELATLDPTDYQLAVQEQNLTMSHRWFRHANVHVGGLPENTNYVDDHLLAWYHDFVSQRPDWNDGDEELARRAYLHH